MKSREEGPKIYTIPGFHYCPLVKVIHAACADIQASDDLQKLPKEPGCSLEHVIAGLMFFSDSTHLANFGTTKAWTLYLYFGNLMKYVQLSLQSGACHLVGFFPFEILLDEEFLQVYHHGIVLQCPDGVLWRIFPRIFTYLADYPEKVLIVTIKDMGLCACPCCLTPKSLFSSLSLLWDMKSHVVNLQAREFIYKCRNTVDGSKVKQTLGEGLWVPTMNKFVNKLEPFSFDSFCMLVVDLMHECELGTWKALFMHLIQLLYVLPRGSQLVATLDSRFCQVPTFGNGTIQKFTNNTSEMR
ncbi:hypothetical protein BDR06DRAFT_982558 [Suillus hirtellus]|nr:hypothetical protein BDR06DRAFT_982558 [Suillus hirtellus]